MAVMTSFVRQLKPGQDLTKISLPSVLCHPFSILEIMSERELLTFHILFKLDNEEDPLKRFLIVLEFIISIIRTEKMEKKPYNPVLGENHICWVNNGAEGDFTEFISEQVSHHPPISALCVKNRKHGLTLEANGSFGVTFAGNKAAVVTAGRVTITTPLDTFELNKIVPDMSINNIIKGTRYIMWEGQVVLSAPSSGYCAVINTEEDKSKTNVLFGHIYDDQEPDNILFEFRGVCGGETQIHPYGKPNSKKVLVDHSKIVEANISYLPLEFQGELDSFRVWKKVSEAIVANDMQTADSEKKGIEAAQRVRSKAKVGDEGYYFGKDPDGLEQTWVFKNNLNVIEWLSLDKNPKGSPDKKPNPAASLREGETPISPGLPLDPGAKVPKQKGEATTDQLLKPTDLVGGVPCGVSPRVPQEGLAAQSMIYDEENDEVLSSMVEETIKANSHITAQKPSLSQQLSDGGDNVTKTNSGFKGGQEDATESITSDEDLEGQEIPEDPKQPKGIKSQPLTATPGEEMTKKAKKQAKKDISQQKKEMRDGKKMVVAKAKEQIKSSLSAYDQKILLQGVAKVRNSLNKWNARVVRLYPGKLVWYKTPPEKGGHENAVILLDKGCFVTQRPTKKEGFCIKIFNVYGHPIHSKSDLKGKPFLKPRMGHANNYCLLLLANSEEGKKWVKKLIAATTDYEATKAFIGNDLPSFIGAEEDISEEDDEETGWEILERGESQNSSALTPSKSTINRTITGAPEPSKAKSVKQPSDVVRARSSISKPAGRAALETSNNAQKILAGVATTEDLITASGTPIDSPAKIRKKQSADSPASEQVLTDPEQIAMITAIVNQAVSHAINSAMETATQTLIERIKPESDSAAAIKQMEMKIESQIKKELALQENKLAFIVRSSVTNFKREKGETPEAPVGTAGNTPLIETLKTIKSTLPANSILILLIFYFLWSISSSLSSLWNKFDAFESQNFTRHQNL